MRITINNALLLIIDVQEKLTPHIKDHALVVSRIARVTSGAAALAVPVMVNEQYKKGLGNTVAELKPLIRDYPHFEKITFSSADDEATMNAIHQQNKKYVIICGIETHVCIMQTALDLLACGYSPVIVCDAVGSRFADDHHIALKRLSQAGAILTTSESMLFELCRNAKSPVFKTISSLVK
ncbi:MAG: hydrolase [Gammaproteobacteria bacterium]|nr:MAG: hydrolase [Gammaproteobacteria bacterium]